MMLYFISFFKELEAKFKLKWMAELNFENFSELDEAFTLSNKLV